MAVLLALCSPLFAFRALQATQPLPDIPILLKRVQKNQERVEQDREKYTFTDVEEQDELARDGRVKKKRVNQYDVFFLHGYLIRRLMKKEDKPLSASAQRKEDARVSKLVKKDEQRAEIKKDQADQVGIAVFLRASLFTHPRWETLNGRKTLAFDFQPNPAFKPKTTAEKIVHELAGVMWVDDQSREVVRLQAGFDRSYKVGGGLLGAIEKGTTVLLEQTFVDGDVWLPSYTALHASVRLLIFKGFHLNVVDQYSDYRVFNVQTLNKLGSPGKAKR